MASWLDKEEEQVGVWLDARLKAAVDQANTDLMADLDTRFASLEKGINDTGVMLSAVSRDVGGVADSVTKLFESVLAIRESIVGQINDAIGRLNPFHLP